ncbi:MAG: tail fiber protein [Saprospiraceae bacterium]|nr:tail fiber protein [Saprospiraceae bacterium]
MTDPFVAEIRIFPFNFAPQGWAFCNGQILPISQNTALFSLLGTTYGGNGLNTFALPDLQGKAPMHPGQGPGLSLHDLGEEGGSETVSLLITEIPAHTHALKAATDPGDTNLPAGNALSRSSGAAIYNAATTPVVAMGINALSIAGNDLPHNNMQPYLTVNFCIALQGIYPPRS